MEPESTGLFFTCTPQGQILHVGTRGQGPLLARPGDNFLDIVEQDSRDKVAHFLEQISSDGSALLWELCVAAGEGCEVLNFFGGAVDREIFVVACKAPQSIFTLYDQLLQMVNDQATAIRQLQVDNAAAVHQRDDLAGFDVDAFTQLTNDLSKAQRELEQKNFRLQQQERRFRAIVSQSVDAIFIVDRTGVIQFANTAAGRLLERDASGLAGQPFTITGHGHPLQDGELVMMRKDGREITCSARSTPIDWEQEPADMITLTDITSLKVAARLREDVERISRHDLKSPLNGIINLPKLMLDDDNLTDTQREFLQLVVDSGHKMLAMINLSLTLFQVEQGVYQYTPLPFDLLHLLRQVVNENKPLAENLRVGLLLDLRGLGDPPPKWVTIQGEELLTYSIVSNLLRNALEASPTGNAVTLTIERGTGTDVVIHNQGLVPPDIQGRFFDKYVTSGKKGGTGLGTYSAKLLAGVQGWDITMRSSLAEGTTVTVHILD